MATATTTAFLEKFMPRTRRAVTLVMGLALMVLAITVLAGLLFVRGLVRGQIAQRDAEALYSTTLLEQLNASSDTETEFRTEDQITFDAAVMASRLRGVMGIRFLRTRRYVQRLDSGKHPAATAGASATECPASRQTAQPFPARYPADGRVHLPATVCHWQGRPHADS